MVPLGGAGWPRMSPLIQQDRITAGVFRCKPSSACASVLVSQIHMGMGMPDGGPVHDRFLGRGRLGAEGRTRRVEGGEGRVKANSRTPYRSNSQELSGHAPLCLYLQFVVTTSGLEE